MTVLRRHLCQFYVVIILMVYVGVDSRDHIRATPKKLKQIHHLQPDRNTSILRDDASKSYMGSKNNSGDVRKTSDQYKWPWKTYEEWKRNQEKIENEIDQILKSRSKNFRVVGDRPRVPNLKRRRFNARKRTNKRPDMRGSKKRRKKKTLMKTQNKPVMTKTNLEENTSTGGAVMAVKFYSTEDGDTTNFGTAPVGHFDVLGRERLLQGVKSRWTSKHNRGANECSFNNGGCEGLCVQSKSSYYCHCPEGFRLDGSRRKCIDLNECLPRNGHGPCQGDCRNGWGSFKCGCDSVPGTQLDADGVTCVLIDRCSETVCSHICINTRSGAFCSCPEGYILDNDWKTCKEGFFND